MIDEHAQFGLAIKNARLDYGLTQEELSERAGITCRYLIAIENEGRIPRYPVIYRLIHGLHISADYIFIPNRPRKIPNVHSSSAFLTPVRNGIFISFFVLLRLC